MREQLRAHVVWVWGVCFCFIFPARFLTASQRHGQVPLMDNARRFTWRKTYLSPEGQVRDRTTTDIYVDLRENVVRDSREVQPKFVTHPVVHAAPRAARQRVPVN
jgi:hypothetical protein